MEIVFSEFCELFFQSIKPQEGSIRISLLYNQSVKNMVAWIYQLTSEVEVALWD